MISKAPVHKATVLVNRRMNVERGVTTFGPVCSSVADMALHHPEGRGSVQEGANLCRDEIRDAPAVVIASEVCRRMSQTQHVHSQDRRSPPVVTSRAER